MTSSEQAVNDLRSVIANTIFTLEVWNSLYEVLDRLGLPHLENPNGLGKEKYLHYVTKTVSDQEIISAAKKMQISYPGTRGKPSDAVIQEIQDLIWWIENNGKQTISNVTRFCIAESLENVKFWGRMSISSLLSTILPSAFNHHIAEIGNDGLLYIGLSSFGTEMFFGTNREAVRPSRISVLEYLKEIGLSDWPDQRFCLFIERIVHPEVQPPEVQKQLVERLNKILKNDVYELRQEGLLGGVPIFKVQNLRSGISKIPKYIIFASNGPKPDIVLEDAVNMDIRIVNYEDKCLVYDEPPPFGDLTWQMLVNWWGKNSQKDGQEIRQELGNRLFNSLQEGPERLFFETYFKHFHPIFREKLPALLPQVYLHYDPRNRNERGRPVLVRQRMDFLMVLRNATRIVIEIDGIQHYAENDKGASPTKYATMVAEDRRLRLSGYEIYRFGGAEFMDKGAASQKTIEFFEQLFTHYCPFAEKSSEKVN